MGCPAPDALEIILILDENDFVKSRAKKILELMYHEEVSEPEDNNNDADDDDVNSDDDEPSVILQTDNRPQAYQS